MDKLQLAELQEIEGVDPEAMEHDGFKIENKQSAEWALRKIKALKEQIKETDELAEMEIERVKMWQQKENKLAEESISFFEYLLQEYMTKERELNPKTKSIKLPHGTVRFKKQQPEYKRNEKELINWAKQNNRNELLKIKESFDWSNLKKNIAVIDGNVVDKETGEIIEHVKVVEREDKFEVVVE